MAEPLSRALPSRCVPAHPKPHFTPLTFSYTYTPLSAPKFIAPLNFILILVGHPLVVFKLDKKKESEDVQGGTAVLLSTAGTGLAVMSFSMAGMNWVSLSHRRSISVPHISW